MTGRGGEQRTEAIRAIYEEYSGETGVVATISDPHNQLAWIQSDHTVPIRN